MEDARLEGARGRERMAPVSPRAPWRSAEAATESGGAYVSQDRPHRAKESLRGTERRGRLRMARSRLGTPGRAGGRGRSAGRNSPIEGRRGERLRLRSRVVRRSDQTDGEAFRVVVGVLSRRQRPGQVAFCFPRSRPRQEPRRRQLGPTPALVSLVALPPEATPGSDTGHFEHPWLGKRGVSRSRQRRQTCLSADQLPAPTPHRPEEQAPRVLAQRQRLFVSRAAGSDLVASRLEAGRLLGGGVRAAPVGASPWGGGGGQGR